ncbi:MULTISPECIES: hypothetical protein [Bacillus cereus group]|uniref:hypothetical protein n=1 Tax=Bacillus cereus group TaxID=86661 RepID=UPI0013EA60E1|nr:hypothetical protein [Bacillus albus]
MNAMFTTEKVSNTKEELANNLWELLVLGELNEDINVKKQFVTIENEIMSNKKSDC